MRHLIDGTNLFHITLCKSLYSIKYEIRICELAAISRLQIFKDQNAHRVIHNVSALLLLHDNPLLSFIA